ncbi:MAG: helix-turn-helix transcriptional regulator [Candidatus Dormibacteria bacterium]
MNSPLRDLGVEGSAETVYLLLLDRPGLTVAEVASLARRTRRSVAAACASLEASGLVSRSLDRPARLTAVRPDVAVEALVLRQTERLQRARLAAADLLERYRRHARPDARVADLLEVVEGREGIAQRFLQLQAEARDEILVLDRPPYVVDPADNVAAETSVLERRVRARVIYDTSSLSQEHLALIREHARAGEQARVMDGVPMKLIIVDRRVGLVPLRQDEPGLEGRLVVHTSPLLDALLVLFETLWRAAAPLPRREAPGVDTADLGLSEDDRMLLALVAAGLKDEVVAARLGITERTVARRLRVLFTRLGATTRFQAGLQAARRGWLE